MRIVHENNAKGGHFRTSKGNEQVGVLNYTWIGDDRFIINLVEVDPEYRDHEIAKKLVMAGIKYAQEKKLKIIPECSYASSIFDKNPELRDLKSDS